MELRLGARRDEHRLGQPVHGISRREPPRSVGAGLFTGRVAAYPSARGTIARAREKLGAIRLFFNGPSGLELRREGRPDMRLEAGSAAGDRVLSYTFLSEERAAVGCDLGLHLVDTQSGRVVRDLRGHTGGVWAVSASNDGRYLLSGSADQTLRIWSPQRSEPVLSLFFAGDDWIAWTPEGYYAASPGGERLVGWHVDHGPEKMADYYPAAQFRKSLYRPDTIRRVLGTPATAPDATEPHRDGSCPRRRWPRCCRRGCRSPRRRASASRRTRPP